MHRKTRDVVRSSGVRVLLLCGIIALFAACTGRAASSDSSDGAVLTAAEAAAALEKCCGDSAIGVGLRIAADYKEPSITTRRFTPEQFWQAVQPMAEYARLDVATAGQSLQGRPLRTITIGSGPTKVLVWSRMKRVESTGTVALADIVRWFANTRNEDRDVDLRERLLSGLTIVLLPIINPDDADAISIADSADVSSPRSAETIVRDRDEGPLSTSERQVLASVRDMMPFDFAIALVERSARMSAGEAAAADAAITLLAQQNAAAGGDSGADDRAIRAAATLAKSFLTELPGRLAKYDDARDLPVLSGLIAESGVRTVVVASGDLEADPQNQRLRSLHVAALLSVFDAMATGAYRGANVALYEQLPPGAAKVVPAGR